MIKATKKLLVSPFAGIYWFFLLFILATLTGELDPLEFIYFRAFPQEDSFGAAAIKLSQIPGPYLAEMSSPAQMQLLLLRHDKSNSDQVKLIRGGGGTNMPPLALGSLGGTVIPQSFDRMAMDPLVLIDVDLPPKTILAVTSTLNTQAIYSNSTTYMFSNGTVEKKFEQESDLVIRTKNEVRSARLLYFLSIISAALIGISVPKFKDLQYVDRDE